jgi:hypothetical protein
LLTIVPPATPAGKPKATWATPGAGRIAAVFLLTTSSAPVGPPPSCPPRAASGLPMAGLHSLEQLAQEHPPQRPAEDGDSWFWRNVDLDLTGATFTTPPDFEGIRLPPGVPAPAREQPG